MKNLAVALFLVIATLSISLKVCIDALQQTKGELAIARIELETRKEISWKLWSLAMTYHNGLKMSVPNFNDEGAPRPMVMRNDDWQSEAKYEFSSDGTSARVLVWGKETDWSFRPKSDR